MKKIIGNENKEVNRTYIMKFFREEATAEEREWMADRMTYWATQKGDCLFFSPFRKEFIEKFCSTEKKSKKKMSMLEEMEQIMANANN